MDAFTSKEYTCFYAKVLDEHCSATRSISSPTSCCARSSIATELERERKVIVEEIRMVEDAPEELVYDLFSRRTSTRAHPLGRPIQGPRGRSAG